MGALTINHNKRDLQFQNSSPYVFGYEPCHVSKKLKSSTWTAGDSSCWMNTSSATITKSSVSRLSLYPKPEKPIGREVHAPRVVVKGFVKGFNSSSFSGRKTDSLGGDRMGNNLFSMLKHAKKAAISTCRHVNFELEDEIVEVTDVNDDVNDGSGDSGVEEVVMVESEKSGELQTIRAKYLELDGKMEERKGFQASTSSGVVSDLIDEKKLESLSLNEGPEVWDVDAGVPYHKRLLNDSAQKHDSRLRRLSFEIELLQQKRASYQLLHPVEKEEKDEDVLVEPFRKLTDDEEELVANALSNSNRRKILVTHEDSNIEITGELLRCLTPGAWLNDEVINVYVELLKEREKREPKKFLKCHFFNTFFYKKLISGRSGYDYKSVRRWTSQKKLGYSLLDCDKIFVPVHKEIHWCLAVINKKEEKFQYLDSLGGGDKQIMRVLAKYIVDEVKDKNGQDIDVTSWKQEFVTDLPNQENGFDCGVFMIKYADFYSRDIGLCFSQENMPYFRKRTAKEILKLRAD